jgi:hypothetical protein
MDQGSQNTPHEKQHRRRTRGENEEFKTKKERRKKGNAGQNRAETATKKE